MAWKGFYIQGQDLKDLSGGGTTITQCSDGSYCCGNGTIGQPCCDQRNGVFLSGGDIMHSPPPTATASLATKSSNTASFSSSVAIPSSNITSSSSPSLLLATFSSLPSSDKSPSGRMTGIIVGAVLGTALILTMGFAIILLKKSWRKGRQAVATDQALASQMVHRTTKLYGDNRRRELDGKGHEVELDGRGHEVELDGGRHEVELGVELLP